MCPMCKDYRFYVLLLVYAIDVRAGLEIFFIFDTFYCVVAVIISMLLNGRTVLTEWYTLYKYIWTKKKKINYTRETRPRSMYFHV